VRFTGNTAGNMAGGLLLTNVAAHTLLSAAIFDANQAMLGGALGKTGASIEQRLHGYGIKVCGCSVALPCMHACPAGAACCWCSLHVLREQAVVLQACRHFAPAWLHACGVEAPGCRACSAAFS
jgi:hypothetical protein